MVSGVLSLDSEIGATGWPKAHLRQASAVGGRMRSGGNLYKLSMFSCCASASTEPCCFCAFSAVCFASSDARPPSCRTPMSSMSTWLAEKTAMPSTRRSICPSGERAAPTFAASNGFAGMHSKFIAFLDNPFMKFHHCPMKRQASYMFNRQPEPLALAEAASVGHQSGRPEAPAAQPHPGLPQEEPTP